MNKGAMATIDQWDRLCECSCCPARPSRLQIPALIQVLFKFIEGLSTFSILRGFGITAHLVLATRTVDFDIQVKGLEVLGYSRTVSKNPDLVTILLDLSKLTVVEE